jgi:hypothetical protein|tara:strand:- start:19373 stop:20608 length:1236 start_codon:yes stop_codon:yes gene_type:complete
MPHGGPHDDDATFEQLTPTPLELAQFRPHLQLEQRTEDKRLDNLTGGTAISPAYQDAEYNRFLNQYSQMVDPSQDPIFGNFGANADLVASTQSPEEIDFNFDSDDSGGGAGGGGIGAAYENYFANQEQAVQDKFDSITGYLDDLQISSDQGFAADIDRITNMYADRTDARNDRFEEALKRPELRQGAAVETLAELGIQADPSLFDPITGATQDMLFSQQMSGADMLNTMSYITETIYDFAKNQQDLSIAAGMENAQQNLISDMAAIQMARDAQAISTAQAAQASAAAQAESDQLMQSYIIMGADIGMSPAVAMAYGELGMLGDAYNTYTDPNNPTMTTVLGGQQVPVTVEQYIAAQNLGLDQAELAASQMPEGYALMVDGQPTIIPFNQLQSVLQAFDQYDIDYGPVPLGE